MPIDADGDSEMASSPDSGQESNPGSRTPTNKSQDHSQLSPPASQTQSQTKTQQRQQQQPEPGSTGVSGLGFGTGQNDGHGLTSEPMVSENNRPGASWMNKRAEEEAHRALEFVVDKDFSLREFGDPFDERDMQEGLL